MLQYRCYYKSMKTQYEVLNDLLTGVRTISLGEAVQTFLRVELSGSSSETVLWYRRRLETLAADLGTARPLVSIFEADLLDYQARLGTRQRKLSTATLRGHVRAIKRFFRWLHRKNVLPVDLSADMKLPRIPRQGKKGIADNSVRAILAEAKTNVRDYALLRFLEATGCRRAGVAGLLLSDLNLDHPDPRIQRRALVREKGDKERTVLLTPGALAALRAWLSARPQVADDHVFLGREPGEGWHALTPCAVSGILRRYKVRLGLTGPCSPHQWRHRFCRKRLQEGMDLSRVSQLAGHEDPTITIKFYGGFAVDDLQDGYDQLVEDLD